MSTFGQTFSTSTPAGSALANTLDTVIQNDKTSVNERFLLEHNAFDSSATGATTIENAAAQGRHKPGNVSAVYIGTTAQIAALTGMYRGAMAYDTTLGILEIYDGSAWTTYRVGDSNNIFSGTELLVSVFGSAALAAAGINYLGTWTLAPTAVANIFDRNIATYWGSTSTRCTTNSLCYWDLGAVYKGNIFVSGQVKTAASESAHVGIISTYDTVPTTTLLASDDYGGFTLQTVTHVTGTGIRPFFGRYVGLSFSASGGAVVYPNISRFEVYGSAV
jgi:hypothetical protein